MRRRLKQSILLIVLLLAATLVSFSQPLAAFSSDTTSGCAPLLVKFADNSTGTPVSWRWELGNGTVSFNQNPSTTYFTPGQYNVKLIVQSAGGLVDSVIKTRFITVFASPIVQFRASDTTGCFPLPVQFTDMSTPGAGTITNWEWDFGDGSTSKLPNPSHTYTTLGNYNVSLRVTNSNGCTTTYSKQNYIRLNNGLTIDYSFSAPESCRPPTEIKFINNSKGTGLISYQWFFGDNSPPSSAANPSHTYTAAGTYSVKLVMRNDFGCRDSVEKVNAINVGTVEAGFSMPAQVCAAAEFSLVNNSSPKPATSFWNFGDGTVSTDLNPTKKYSLPGDYTIKLVSDFGACRDSVSKTIRVLPLPAPAFTATNQLACKAPLTISFTNESLNGVSYTWLFGDGTTSNEQKPSHTYQKTGEYDVTLVVTGANGCRDSLRKKGFVQIIPARVSIKNLSQEGCAPLNFKPELEVNSVEPLSSYRWDFGDGTTSTEANPANTYSRPGNYTVKLFFTTRGGCADSVIYPLYVHVGTKPAVNFTATPRDACALQPVSLTDLSTGAPVSEWLWKFGDGSTSTESNPEHIYGDTGYYHVTLIATNNGCKDSLTINDFIHIRAPIARFKDSSTCSLPFVRHFTDLSIGAKSWFWDFGDGTTSPEQNPTHSFPKPGSYFVKLRVTSDTCENTVTRQVQIISEQADFSASDTMVCKGAIVEFNMANFNQANVTQAGWLFGDGFAAAGSNVKHSFSKSGVYSIKLFIKDLNGCTDTLTKTDYIRVSGPTANFSSVQGTVCPGTLVSFNDLSSADGSNAITQWSWNYGDGSKEILSSAPFQHRYTNAGTFNVQLSVTDSQGCTDSITKTGVVQISKPNISFTSPDSISCSNKNIRFFNQSSGSGVGYTWDFGDGTPSSNVFQPAHSYLAEGSYSISLKATDRFGCRDSLTKPGYVRIRNPRSGFTLQDSVSTCPPLVTTFTNTSSNFVEFEWNFGDGTRSKIDSPTHFYNLPGTYNASLVITSLGGCRDSAVKKLVVRGPQGDFSYEKTIACTPVGLPFRASTKDKVSFIWDFNDGSTVATNDSNITHIYTIPGKYLPRLILVDPQGCRVPIIGRDTITVLGVEAKFSSAQQLLCDSGLVSLRDESVSNDEITSYLWSFSNGSTSSERNPSPFFRQTGSYPVSLLVHTRFGCTDTSDQVLGVDVVQSPSIAIKGDTTACAPGLIRLAGDIIRPDTARVNWSWDFGNGEKAGVQFPEVIKYPAAGIFQVTAVAVNSKGCADTARSTLNIYPVPEPDAGRDSVICLGQAYNLQGKAENYSWTPSGTLSCTDCSSPVARPTATTIFHLGTTNIYGCKSEDSVIIEVKQPFSVNTSPGDTLCIGSSLELFASGAELYQWTPTAGLDNPAAQRPRTTPAVTTTYQVIGTDAKSCFADTAYVPVIVYPYPLVDAGQDKTIAVGGSVTVKAAVSPDVSGIRWQPLTGLSCANCAEPLLTPKQTTTYKVAVENAGGCAASDELTIFVLCNQGNLFVPNTFSPNGDGKNDVLYPRGKGIFNIKSFKVFNRWGEIVYQRFNFQANDNSTGTGWDGKFKGINAGQDVYVYLVEVVCENGAILPFKGDVTLIR